MGCPLPPDPPPAIPTMEIALSGGTKQAQRGKSKHPLPIQLVWLCWATASSPQNSARLFLDPLPSVPLGSTPGWTPGPRLRGLT